MIINDLMPFKNKFIQNIQIYQCAPNFNIDPTNPDHILGISRNYKDLLELSKKNAKNILQNKRTEKKAVYKLFDDFFQSGEYNNYNAVDLVKSYGKNYYRPWEQGMYDQFLATYYSFAGNIDKADSVWCNLIRGKSDICFEETDNIDFMSKISDNQVVIFNEAHHVPKHRYLVGTLLDTLYEKGFRYLALEAFYNDSLFSTLNFPTTGNGFYIRESTFANLIRKALEKGYRIIGYDNNEKERERLQAESIYNQTLKDDKNAKIVVLAGYAHISRDWMAGEFEKISGIRPLTINQTYAYSLSLGNKNMPQDSVFLIRDTTDNQQKFDADLLIYNNLIIKNNCFSSTNSLTTSISVPDSLSENCSIICLYNKHELDCFNNNEDKDWKPLPIGVYHPQNQKEITINLCEGEYEVLFFNDYGQALFTKGIKIAKPI